MQKAPKNFNYKCYMDKIKLQLKKSISELDSFKKHSSCPYVTNRSVTSSDTVLSITVKITEQVFKIFRFLGIGAPETK